MKGYKAFYRYKDSLRCRDKLYEIGKTYEEDSAILCVTGMHFCKRCIDCFRHYDPRHAVICEVEAPDDCVTEKVVRTPLRSLDRLTTFQGYVFGWTNVCTTKLTILREIDVEDVYMLCAEELDLAEAHYKVYSSLPDEVRTNFDALSVSEKLKDMEMYIKELSVIEEGVFKEMEYWRSERLWKNSLEAMEEENEKI